MLAATAGVSSVEVSETTWLDEAAAVDVLDDAPVADDTAPDDALAELALDDVLLLPPHAVIVNAIAPTTISDKICLLPTVDPPFRSVSFKYI